MQKRYLIILSVFITLVGCFFLFFDKPSNQELYNKYYNKIERRESFDSLDSNNKLNVNVESKRIDNEYHYVLTFTSDEKLNNFKQNIGGFGIKKHGRNLCRAFDFILLRNFRFPTTV